MKKLPILHSRQRGMTLIEVLVSLLIFSLGFLGLIGMQARAIQISSDAQDRGRAALLANEIVSTMWMQKSATVATPDLAAWNSRLSNQAASGLPNANGLITGPDANGLVKVTITWRAPVRGSATVQASTYTTQVVIE